MCPYASLSPRPLRPLVPFAGALLANGHEVLVVGPPTLDPRGLPFRGPAPPRPSGSCGRRGRECLADRVHVERWVPQEDVLGHADAGVCHGGSGTMLGDERYRRAAEQVADEMRRLPPIERLVGDLEAGAF
jgi:hypothetical protein